MHWFDGDDDVTGDSRYSDDATDIGQYITVTGLDNGDFFPLVSGLQCKCCLFFFTHYTQSDPWSTTSTCI